MAKATNIAARTKATLTIASKNYGSWSLRGWLLCKFAGLAFEEQTVASDDPSTRAELLLLSPSFLVPCLTHNGTKVWDTLAIAEYLNEALPDTGLMPKTIAGRAHCRRTKTDLWLWRDTRARCSRYGRCRPAHRPIP